MTESYIPSARMSSLFFGAYLEVPPNKPVIEKCFSCIGNFDALFLAELLLRAGRALVAFFPYSNRFVCDVV